MSQKKTTFEESLTALEGLVGKLEAGELTLDESLKAFEEGNKLVAACKEQLAQAEVTVEKVLKQGETS
jgi:exodeoxyribonuclease VII small subunit